MNAFYVTDSRFMQCIVLTEDGDDCSSGAGNDAECSSGKCGAYAPGDQKCCIDGSSFYETGDRCKKIPNGGGAVVQAPWLDGTVSAPPACATTRCAKQSSKTVLLACLTTRTASVGSVVPTPQGNQSAALAAVRSGKQQRGARTFQTGGAVVPAPWLDGTISAPPACARTRSAKRKRLKGNLVSLRLGPRPAITANRTSAWLRGVA